ncbi:MAG TPA: thermonuclease family protein [Noviherbaspirillum sp.]|nr:thermonuclease family protein [Noviherbaspirillum sp.]
MTLLVDRQPLKVRLANIDAPEKSQPFGQRSKQSLSDLCFKKDATYQVQNADRYGRTVAIVTCGGVQVNRAQVERGMAWVYPKYNRDAFLPDLQVKAEAARRGLWVDKSPTPPWDFRHGKVPPKSGESTCYTGPRGGRYHLANGRKQYGC